MDNRLRQIIREEVGRAISKRTMMNRIYKVTQNLTSHLYSDEHWQGIDDMYDAIASVGVNNINIYPDNGGYRTSNDGLSQWKQYNVEIEYDGVIINGELNCHAAGTVEDPFSRYDMTLVMW